MRFQTRGDPEEQLVSAVIKHFETSGSFRIYREVLFIGKRIDVVLIDNKTSEIHAIETKVSWWERAINQAKLDLLGVDKAYIGLPSSRIHSLPRYRNHLENYGIGFLAISPSPVSPHITEVISARFSRYKTPRRQQELRATIQKGFYLNSTSQVC